MKRSCEITRYYTRSRLRNNRFGKRQWRRTEWASDKSQRDRIAYSRMNKYRREKYRSNCIARMHIYGRDLFERSVFTQCPFDRRKATMKIAATNSCNKPRNLTNYFARSERRWIGKEIPWKMLSTCLSLEAEISSNNNCPINDNLRR